LKKLLVEVDIDIIIKQLSKDEIECILKSLSPDNVQLPGSLEIKSLSKDDSAIMCLKGLLDLNSLIRTLNDIFTNLKVVVDLISRTKPRNDVNKID